MTELFIQTLAGLLAGLSLFVVAEVLTPNRVPARLAAVVNRANDELLRTLGQQSPEMWSAPVVASVRQAIATEYGVHVEHLLTFSGIRDRLRLLSLRNDDLTPLARGRALDLLRNLDGRESRARVSNPVSERAYRRRRYIAASVALAAVAVGALLAADELLNGLGARFYVAYGLVIALGLACFDLRRTAEAAPQTDFRATRSRDRAAGVDLRDSVATDAGHDFIDATS